MIQENKELLLKDLCARLPYGIKCYYEKENGKAPIQTFTIGALSEFANNDNVICKPYLRPMSSMTEKECIALSRLRPYNNIDAWKYIKTPVPLHIANIKQFDFFLSHHLDWRGLIQIGLAIEAKEGMYPKM